MMRQFLLMELRLKQMPISLPLCGVNLLKIEKSFPK